MSEDIVSRLRDAQLNHDELRFGWLAEASDEIERLRARIAELEKAAAEVIDLVDVRVEDGDTLVGEINELLHSRNFLASQNLVFRARVAELEREREWRPMRDRPPANKRVLVAYVGADGRCHFTPATRLTDRGGMWDDYGDSVRRAYAWTHVDLPAPKEGA